MTVTRWAQVLGLSVALVVASTAKAEAQVEHADCQSASSRLRSGIATASDVQRLGSCAQSGPPALADAWKHPSGRSEAQYKALVEATATLRDDQLFAATSEVALSSSHPSLDRVRALQVLALYYDSRFAPSLEFLTTADVGSPIPGRVDSYSVSGATPLRASARSEIGQILARLSTSEADALVRGAARRLRQSIAHSNQADTPLAPGAISLVAQCGSAVSLQSNADIGVQVQLQVDGARPFRRTYWIAAGDARGPAKRLLDLPPGIVTASYAGTEVARLTERTAPCPQGATVR